MVPATDALSRRLPAARRLLVGDEDAAREHLTVAAAVAGAVSVVAVLVGTLGVVVSPVVWEVVLAGGVVALLALPAANAYWRGGVAVGYLLVVGPLLAGAAGAAAGGSVGGDVRLVGTLIGLLVAVPVAHLLGSTLRRLRALVRPRRGERP